MKIKVLTTALLTLMFFNVCGCAVTQTVIGKAQVRNKVNDEGKMEEEVNQPGWLVLVPFAFVFDAATCPIQGAILLFTYHEGH